MVDGSGRRLLNGRMKAQDEFSRHEALHTAHLLSDMFDRHLLVHPAVTHDAVADRLAKAISERLGELYQALGRD